MDIHADVVDAHHELLVALGRGDAINLSPAETMLMAKEVIEQLSRPAPWAAIGALRNGQRQLDQDGVFVGVSRQALDELLKCFAVPGCVQRVVGELQGVDYVDAKDERNVPTPDPLGRKPGSYLTIFVDDGPSYDWEGGRVTVERLAT